MRITLDTGILVRMNVKATGPARRLLETILTGPHELVLSEFLLTETTRALGYPRLQKLYKLTPEEIVEHVELLRARADIVSAVVYEPIELYQNLTVGLLPARDSSERRADSPRLARHLDGPLEPQRPNNRRAPSCCSAPRASRATRRRSATHSTVTSTSADRRSLGEGD